jgi:hypothetical protein
MKLEINTTAKRILVFALLALMVALIVAAVPPLARIRTAILCDAGETNCVEAWSGASITMYSDAASTQVFAVNGSTGTVRHKGYDILDASTAISVTNGGIITPTATYQPLQSAGTVTATIETTGYVTGTRLVLINTSNTTINVQDTGTQMLSAAWAAGQYDVLVLWFDGTNWIEISRSNN